MVLRTCFSYKTFRVEDYFEHIFLSYEMKMAKPDEEIFRKVLDDAGLDPKETFFIDDSEANCMTARSLGISTYVPKPVKTGAIYLNEPNRMR